MESRESQIVLDIGTGSGAIGIAIAKEMKNSKVLACDLSDNALEIAKINGLNLEVPNIKNLKI